MINFRIAFLPQLVTERQIKMAVTRNNLLNNTPIRDQYIRGVKLLKNDFLRSNWPNTYDIFVIWHFYSMMTHTPPDTNDGRNAAHSGPAFLPWHRWMLILLENHLQRVLNDSNFGLPYWNWAIDGDLPLSQQPLSPLWSNDCMGGSGSPVNNGPFAVGSWQVNIEGSLDQNGNPVVVSTNRGLQRELGMDPLGPRLPTTSQIKTIVDANGTDVIFDTFPWNQSSSGFRNSLEGWPNGPSAHNRIHVWIGGDMAPATSPNDPAFYLNHCNVDRIWAGWQQIHNNPSYLPAANESSSLMYHRLDDLLYAITIDPLFDPIYQGNVTPANLIDTSSIYAYDTINDLS